MLNSRRISSPVQGRRHRRGGLLRRESTYLRRRTFSTILAYELYSTEDPRGIHGCWIARDHVGLRQETMSGPLARCRPRLYRSTDPRKREHRGNATLVMASRSPRRTVQQWRAGRSASYRAPTGDAPIGAHAAKRANSERRRPGAREAMRANGERRRSSAGES